jgi:hypothetical protein
VCWDTLSVRPTDVQLPQGRFSSLFTRGLLNLKVHHRVHKSPPSDFIPRQLCSCRNHRRRRGQGLVRSLCDFGGGGRRNTPYTNTKKSKWFCEKKKRSCILNTQGRLIKTALNGLTQVFWQNFSHMFTTWHYNPSAWIIMYFEIYKEIQKAWHKFCITTQTLGR